MLKWSGGWPDVPRVVPRLAAPTVLIACAASLLAAPSALAQPQLPAGADAPPNLPAGVVVAEHPRLTSETGQSGGDLVAGAARAKSKRADGEAVERPFWATVNVCDTEKSPNAVGVRTSVPGNGSNERIFARYTAQWWSGAKEEWLTVGGSGVTDWIRLGDADMASRQAGWTFHFVQPPAGTTYVMRGVVELQWRDELQAARRVGKARGGRSARRQRVQRQHRAHRVHKHRKARRAQRVAVVRERTLLTETGMRGVQGGDPAGLSKAMCLIW
jgi:hypothetical protein